MRMDLGWIHSQSVWLILHKYCMRINALRVNYFNMKDLSATCVLHTPSAHTVYTHCRHEIDWRDADANANHSRLAGHAIAMPRSCRPPGDRGCLYVCIAP